MRGSKLFSDDADGVPMGSPLSPILAEIFMSILRKNEIMENILFWTAYYVDNAFIFDRN